MKQSNTDLEDKVVTLEGKCSTMSQQLALLASDLQSEEDENVTLLEKINGLQQSNGIKGGILYRMKAHLIRIRLHRCTLFGLGSGNIRIRCFRYQNFSI